MSGSLFAVFHACSAGAAVPGRCAGDSFQRSSAAVCEFGVGGQEYVVPTLKACLLARSLLENLPPEEIAEAEHGAEREVIALWEAAEGKAIVAAFKPFNRDMGEARFEISV